VTATVTVGHPAHQLVHTAKTIAADLIVVGHDGHSALWGGLLGGTAERVARRAPCSILIFRPPPPTDSRPPPHHRPRPTTTASTPTEIFAGTNAAPARPR
jgi:hypothetical protein